MMLVCLKASGGEERSTRRGSDRSLIGPGFELLHPLEAGHQRAHPCPNLRFGPDESRASGREDPLVQPRGEEVGAEGGEVGTLDPDAMDSIYHQQNSVLCSA